MTPSRIEYRVGTRRAILTHYGKPRMWAVECQRWSWSAKDWRTASDRASEHTTRRAAEQAAQAWCEVER